MSEEYLEQKRLNIDKFIRKLELKKIFSVFSDVRNSVAEKTVFYDFVGDMFVKRPKFFLTTFFKLYNKNIVKILSPGELFEMEQHILQKHCLYPNEKLIISFDGKYVLGAGKEVGRLHLTNYRIIFQGLIKSTGLPMYNYNPMIKHMHKKLLYKLQPTDIPCFGYEHSLLGFPEVTLKVNQVILKVPLGKIVIQAFGDRGFEVAKVVYETIINANNLNS
ncbi:MAG: hypothetical protein ACFE9R_17700 [Candidatus Hermodarchaeota archaeon]